MAILQLPPNPTSPEPDRNPASAPGPNPVDGQPAASSGGFPPHTMRTNRYGDLEEHELIHLLDTLDDERARAQFRESVYISTIICLAVAWFLFYGPHLILHQPYYKDPIALMKQHDLQRLTYINPTPPAPAAPPKIDRRTMQQLQKQAQETAKAKIAPQAPAPPAPAQQAMNTTPQMPALPTPTAPKPNAPAPVDAPLPSAPKPTIADNSQSPGEAVRNAMRGAMSGPNIPSAPSGGSPGPLQAGASILSDTQGVDFTAYMRRLRSDIYRNWLPVMPPEVEPPLRKRGIVGIRFSILPDGQIGDMKLETQSGDVALDRAAWYAITGEGQFPPLPRQYHGPQLDLRIGFFYNQPIDK